MLFLVFGCTVKSPTAQNARMTTNKVCPTTHNGSEVICEVYIGFLALETAQLAFEHETALIDSIRHPGRSHGFHRPNTTRR